MLLALVFRLVLALRQSISITRADPQVRSRALERPVSASVLVTLMATPFMYPEAPLVIRSLTAIALLAAMLRMLTLYVDKSLWRQLFVITGLAIVDRVITALSLEVLMQRLGRACVESRDDRVFGWSLRAHVERGFGLSPPRQRYVRWLIGGGLLLSAAGVLFNVLGNATLAGALQGRCRQFGVACGQRACGVRDPERMAHLTAEALERRGVQSVIRHRAQFVHSVSTLFSWLGFITWVWYSMILFRIDAPILVALSALLAASGRSAHSPCRLADPGIRLRVVACVSCFASHADRVERRRVADFPLHVVCRTRSR